jgi:hypothetical protein
VNIVLYTKTALTLLILSATLTGCASNQSMDSTSKHEVVNLRGVIDPRTDFVLEGNDGQQVKANVLTVFRVDNKAYALVKQHDSEDTPSLMELAADQKQASFRMIKDRSEFDRVLQIVATHPEIYPR